MNLLTTRYARSYILSLAACLLAACGGGGGDGGGGLGNISLSANATSATQISLSWSEPTNLSVSPYVVARSDDNSSARIGSTPNRSFLVAGLSAGTRYCFEIRDPLTGTRLSNVACATTQEDLTAPTQPSSLTATAVSPVSIEVSWIASSDESGVAGYNVFRDGLLVATQSGVRFTDSALAPATDYCYRVSAVDNPGNESPQSNEACATTVADTANPSVPQQITAAYSDENGIATVAVTWSPSSDDSGIAGYTVFRNGVEIAGTTTPGFDDTSIQVDTTYCYTVSATDVVGKTSAVSEAACTRTSWRKRSLGVSGVGSATIRLDASDVPHVAYKLRAFDPDVFEYQSTLNLGRIGDTFDVEALDVSFAYDYIWGDFSMDMALDAAGNAHILHQSMPVAAAETLQYVIRSASQTDTTNIQVLGDRLSDVDLAIDAIGRLHACIQFGGILYYGNTAAGPWSFEPLDVLVAGPNGNNCSIAIDASDAVHIAYLETFSNDLWYAGNATGIWTSERVDQQSGTSTNTIYHTAITTDSAGFAHIAYAHDFAENDMEYATNASGSWTSEKVDDTGTVGYASDIVVDSTDRVYVLYEELADDRPLHLAARDGSTWDNVVLSSSGFGQDLSMDGDSIDALHIVFNNESGELSYLTNRR
jgi:chitodextrinase